MAIKTNELQQLTSALGTDSVLLDTGSAGTARLSLDRLKAFTLGQPSVPARTVEKAAADLPDYIAGLPRLLAERLTVKVSGTLTADALLIDGIYGPGSLLIRAEADGDAVFKTSATVSRCAVPVTFLHICFQDPKPGVETSRNGLSADYGGMVIVQNCSFSSENGGNEINHCYRALFSGHASTVYTLNLRAAHCGVVLLPSYGGAFICGAAAADDVHNNACGVYAYHGGLVMLTDKMPDTLGATGNAKNGALIVSASGTLL